MIPVKIRQIGDIATGVSTPSVTRLFAAENANTFPSIEHVHSVPLPPGRDRETIPPRASRGLLALG